MNIRRWTVGVIAATLFVPGLAACKAESADSGNPAASAASAIPADPKEALLASTKGIQEGNYTFALSGYNLSGKGLVHKPSNSAQLTAKFDDGSGDMSIDMDLIYIQPESWVKMDLGGAMFEGLPGAKERNGKYQHLDQTKIKNAKGLHLNGEDMDPVEIEALVKGISEVQKTGEGSYEGKIDISGAGDSAGMDADVVKTLGEQAKSLPFTAKLDSQGRLTELVVAIPAAGEAKAHEVKVTLAEYGNATAAQKPPADKVVEASDETYQMFQ